MREDKERLEIKGWDFIEWQGWDNKATRKNRKKLRRAIKRGAKHQSDLHIKEIIDSIEGETNDNN